MKKFEKRFISGALVVTLVAAMIGISPGSKDLTVTHAALTVNTEQTVRGAIDALSDLPQYQKDNWQSLERGTAARPFVVLEVVPYEEYAEFGYLIGGCEPVNINRMLAKYADMQIIANAFDGISIEAGTRYFFEDELKYLYRDDPAIGDFNNFVKKFFGVVDDNDLVGFFSGNGTSVKGHYERVAPGQGYFKLVVTRDNEEVDPGTISLMDLDPVTLPVSIPSESTQAPEESQMPEENLDDAQVVEEPELDTADDDVIEDEYEEEIAIFDPGPGLGAIPREEEIAEEESDTGEVIGAPEEAAPVNTESVINEARAMGVLVLTSISGNGEDDDDTNDTNGEINNDNSNQAKSIAGGGNVDQRTVSDNGTASGNDQPTYKISFKPVTGTEAEWIWLSEEDQNVSGDYDTLNKEFTLDEIKGVTKFNAIRNSGYHEVTNYVTSYTNDERFLTNTLGLSADAAKTYSIVVKTITPAQLNDESAWIDYADLIFLSPLGANSYGGEDLLIVWANYNDTWETNKSPSTGAYQKNAFENSDFTWGTTLKMYNKVTADSNYASIIINDAIYKDDNVITGGHKRSDLWQRAKDWNLDDFVTEDNDSQVNQQVFNVSNNNIYKLCVMLMCMDSNLFKQLYLSGSNPLIKDGKYTLQTMNNADDFWGLRTFLLVRPNTGKFAYTVNGDTSINRHYWDSEELWNSYHYLDSFKDFYCQDHVYTYNGHVNNSSSSDFVRQYTTAVPDNDRPDKAMFSECNNSLNGQPFMHASAVKYILNSGDCGHYGDPNQTMNVLDIEPSVGLNNNCDPDWKLKESYVRMLVPSYRGKINITHQTTAHFISMAEDLNAEYHMVYMGLDASAYDLYDKTITLNDNKGTMKVKVPNWNDATMRNSGRIYVHIGDMMFGSKYDNVRDGVHRKRDVDWMSESTAGNVDTWTNVFMRYPGNDISKIKKGELESFLLSGRPVVAEEHLYNLESVIGPNTVVRKFVEQAKNNGRPLYNVRNAAAVDDTMRKVVSATVTFDKLPNEYNGVTDNYSAEIRDDVANYLPVENGRSYLYFSFNVAEEGYSFRIYVDQNKNSRFEDDEIIMTRPAEVGKLNEYKYQVGASTVGLVQWKIEVYKNDTPDIRYVRTGCSAVSRAGSTSYTKKEVKVLQIMPFDWDPADYGPNVKNDGRLNLETNEIFQKYIVDLKDYDLQIHSVTWDEFSKSFENLVDDAGNPVEFDYDYTLDMVLDDPDENNNNPKNLKYLNANPVTRKSGEVLYSLDDYNMIIMGFGDTYGGKDISNEYGQVDYIRYFLAIDKSILFTHDLSSMYNASDTRNTASVFGFTVNALMRDLMGMNRYGVVSRYASETGDPAEADRLAAYQAANAGKYDTLEWDEGGVSVAAHGYTYYAMKRVGMDPTITEQENNNYKQGGVISKLPYKYMVINPNGIKLGANGPIPNTNPRKYYDYTATGYNDDMDITTKASKVNVGQITVYPYKISDTLTVSRTHGQWYALSPEDPDVTVWYCLTTDDSKYNTVTSDGTSLTYAVSPNDGMNNYYIYSKGNIFYSGVGHSTIGRDVNDPQDMEVKLFVNTMIAAAGATFDPPVVEVGGDAVPTEDSSGNNLVYRIDLIQNFDDLASDADGSKIYSSTVSYNYDDTYTVDFTPVDYNLASTELKCTIKLGDGTDIQPGDIMAKYNTQPAPQYQDTVNSDGTISRTYYLNNRQDYVLVYRKSNLNQDKDVKKRTVIFTIWNDRVKDRSTTTVRMTLQPLFPLD